MSQAAPTTAQPLPGRVSATLRAVVFVALLTGSLYPDIGPTTVATIGAVCAAPLIVWEILRALPRIHPAVPITAILFAALLLPLRWTEPLTDYGQDKVSQLMTATLLSALAATLIRDRRHVPILAWVWLAGSLILAATSFFEVGVYGRAGGFAASPIWLARELATGVLVALWLAWQRRLRPVLATGAVLFLCVALLGTGSRGPLVAAAFAIMVFLAATRPKVSDVGAAFFCFALAAVIGVVAYLPDLIPARFRAFIESPTGAVEASGRAELWEAAPDLIRDNPWGIGWGNWILEVNTTLHWPHNLFAEVLIEAGWLPGAVVLVALAATLVRAVRRARHDPELSLILLLLAATVVSVSVSGDINARTFFALLVLCWVATSWPRPDHGSVASTTTAPVRNRTTSWDLPAPLSRT